MKKDVIYVDIEDDITSIIDKVKGAEASIVALVPPKRIGVLQSVVNLKLLQKAAKSAKKHVVLITSDQALSALAAGVAMPVAKNLQSKPEIPEITALDVDDEDIINGDELPVGDLAQTAPKPTAAVTPPSVPTPPPTRIATTPMAATAAKNAPKKGPRVPNFEIFRKNIFLFAGIGVLLIAGLIWAIFFAPRATVTITAKTNVANINQQLTLVPNGTLDTTQKVLPAIVQQTKKTNSIDFDATGKKEVGDKATGTVSFENAGGDPASIPAGTQATTSAGLVFVTNSSVTVPKATLTFGNECGPDHLCPGTATVGVTAIGPGMKYNGATGSVSGGFDGASGGLTGATSGGTDRTATVVSQDDVDKAKGQLTAQNAEQVKKELKKQFKGDIIIIDESFKADAADPVSSPKVGEEVSAKAKLTSETTYTLVAVQRSDLKSVFSAYLKTQINSDEQKIYADGDEVANFSQFQPVDKNYTVRVQADGQVGPKIDDAALKPQLAGKRAGEIQQLVNGIQGVEDVDTKFSPFWVTTAPDAKKITIKFVLKNDAR